MIVLSYLTAFLIGMGLLTRLRGSATNTANPVVISCLALGLGLAVSSILYFVWGIVILKTPNRAFVSMEVMLAVFAAHYWWTKRASTGRQHRVFDVPALNHAYLAGAVAVVLAGVAHFALIAKAAPHGDGDAWMIWNLRAQYLYRGDVFWRNAFAPEIIHAAYPPYVPTLVARGWVYAGHETVAVPISLAAVWTATTVGLLAATVAKCRTWGQGLLAGIALAGTPFFVTHGASLTADVPMACNLLLGVSCLVLASRDDDAGWCFLLAGVFLGTVAWTKNEGALYALVLGVVWLGMRARHAGPSAAAQTLRRLAASALIPTLVWAYFKLAIAPSTDLARNLDPATAMRLITDPHRYVEIAQGIGWLMVNAPLRFVPLLLPLGAAYIWLTGIDVPERDRTAVRSLGIAIGLMACGLVSVYLVTFWPVAKHVTESFDRLVLQLWPITLLWIFLVARAPETPKARPKSSE